MLSILILETGGAVQAENVMDGKALYQDVVRYAEFSPHRTETPGDKKGGYLYFHTRLDTPETTGPEFLEPVGRALVRTIEQLEEQ